MIFRRLRNNCLSSWISSFLLRSHIPYRIGCWIFATIIFWNSIFHKCSEESFSFSMALFWNIDPMGFVSRSWFGRNWIRIKVRSRHPWRQIGFAKSLLRINQTRLWIVVRFDLRVVNDLFCMLVEHLLVLLGVVF